MSSGDSPSDRRAVASVIPLVPAWRLDRAFDYLVPPELAGQVAPGCLVRVPLGPRTVRGVVVGRSSREAETERLLELRGLVVRPPLCPPPLDDLLAWLARRYAAPRGSAFARVVPPRVRARVEEQRPLSGGPAPRRLLAYSGGPELLQAIEAGASGAWCLQVLPGEDRAEVVAELVAAAGRASRGAALVAVPEVRYGSAVLDGLQRYWPDVARVDSSRSEMERARAWLRLAGGHGVGAGGRAAVLAPAPDLGLLVLDEEHHRTYKEERSPRYDARRVALKRAGAQRSVCVLVSTTPSLEAGAAARSGSLGLVEPKREARRAARPVVEVVPAPAHGGISPELQARMKTALAERRRVGLLAPARGYARAVWCGSCRRSLRCPACEMGLAFERSPARLRCCRCGYSADAPERCPNCGARALRYLGAGSERLAEQLAKAFPRARVGRVDPDVLARRGAAASAEDADIYVTTWIGTKEALRPVVSMVGVIDADWVVRRLDFRAGENAYQALVEMAEWAGPASRGGRLVVQSSDPAHHAIQAVVRADYGFFLERELAPRAELGYPPYSELIRIQARGEASGALIERAASACRSLGDRVLGPTSVAAERGGDAMEILVKSADAERAAERLRGILAEAPPGARMTVDVDPR